MQWFLSMEKLAGPATRAVLEDEIKLRSRKIQELPTVTGSRTSRTGASRASSGGASAFPPATCPKAATWWPATADEALAQAREPRRGDAALHAQPTCGRTRTCSTPWFSSRPWPISVFDGHPQRPNNEDIEYDYPTGRSGDRPRHHLLLGGPHDHGRLRIPRREALRSTSISPASCATRSAARCPSSSATSPDPLDLIAQYGADGMRVAMLLASPRRATT